MLLLVICGFAVMMETAASNTILQTIVDDDKRGRVMSFYAMAFLGVAPLGSLLAGSLASHLGAAHVVQLAATMCIVGSLVFACRLPTLRKFVRPIYRRIGILPNVTSGIPCEAEVTVPENGREKTLVDLQIELDKAKTKRVTLGWERKRRQNMPVGECQHQCEKALTKNRSRCCQRGQTAATFGFLDRRPRLLRIGNGVSRTKCGSRDGKRAFWD